LKDCDIFVAATESEKANVLSALYAKNAGAKKIFVRIDNPEAEAILEKLGFFPINTEHFAARSVELMITRPAVSDLVNIGIGQFDIIEMPAKGTKIVGKELSNAKGRFFTTIATCVEAKYCFAKEKKIEPNETIILLVDSGKEKQAEKEIK
jgi:trk system potassium uptake protein TrkA